MFRKKTRLTQFGAPADQTPTASPEPRHSPAPKTSETPTPPPTKKEPSPYGTPLRIGKIRSSQHVPATPPSAAPSQPTSPLDKLGSVLERYITALKRELIIEDLMRDFMENSEQFLADAEKCYLSDNLNGLNIFLITYAKPYAAIITLSELTNVLARLSLQDKLHIIDQIDAIRERILAGNKMPVLLSHLDDSSANVLLNFTQQYQALSKAEQEEVTTKIIDSLPSHDSDYLVGILAYASTMMLCKRDADSNFIYKTKVISKTETTIETGHTIDTETTVVTLTLNEFETEIIEKFPMRAAEKIASLINAAAEKHEEKYQAELQAKPANNPQSIKSSLFQAANRNSSILISPRKNVTNPRNVCAERVVSLLNLDRKAITEHQPASRSSSKTMGV